MSDPIDRQKVIDICNRAIDLLNGELGTGAMTAVRDWIVNLPSAQTDNTCNGCRYERFGNRVCDQCSRFYMDRYEVKQDG